MTQRLQYKLPGHLGSVNDVHFHPNEPISKLRKLREMEKKREKKRGGKRE